MEQYKRILNMLKKEKGCESHIETLNNIYMQDILDKILPILLISFVLSLCVGYCSLIIYGILTESSRGIRIIVGVTVVLILVFIVVLIFKVSITFELSSDKVVSLNTFLASKPMKLSDLGVSSITDNCIYYSVSLSSPNNGIVGIYPLSDKSIPDVVYVFRKIESNNLVLGGLGYTLDLIFLKESKEN